ncbi:phage terminase large subunit family protein [Brevibacillus fulvus]|uniref:Phage terminase large subunit GpA-like protein n=1 Tax=Brevibacillus fulvus TaxID=1125967 RepID=A0A938Y5F2_9BACL|nr:phage terminase large subunit family protein [Brevibacillus fulvus]MBM7592266.1 phage terminase large subunit GpA-like protein [Brevibacillus fulvus]
MRTRKNRTFRLFKEIAKLAAPPPDLTVSEWADEYRYLSPEDSAEPGKWRTDRAPYQREMMDAVNDPDVETVVFMTSAQVGKTAIISNIIGYHIHQDPAPMMLIQPTLELAQAYSKDRLAPMLRDTPVLRGKVKDAKARDSGNTMLHKIFPGGHITMAGANSPSSLASRPIRIVLCDEVDRYPISAGTEGDPVSLVAMRASTFLNRKIILVSTPTIRGASRIETAYEDSTMEQWCLPCPSCEEYQPLSWKQIRFEDATHVCKFCGAIHDEFEWKEGKGKWIARKENPKIRGFHLNALASPWRLWSELIEMFQKANADGPEKLKVFINTILGETWEENSELDNIDTFLDRREEYEADLPDGVLLLTAGVDTQDDRLEYEIVGWGKGHESWGIEYGVIIGKPDDAQTMQQLDDVLNRVYKFQDGKGLKVACTCIDSGGHYTTEIYKYTKRNEHRRILAIKGLGSPGIPLIHRYSRNNKEKALLVTLGVDDGKSSIYSALKVQEPGPRYCHFPSDDSRGYDRFYFQGLLSEKLVPRKKNGAIRYTWEKVSSSVRNEALDTRNYAQAAREIINPNYEALEKRLKGTTASVSTPVRKRQELKKQLVKKTNIW